MITPRQLYAKAEAALEPLDGLALALCVILIGVTGFMMFQPSRALRAAWVVYMFSP